MRLGLRQVLAVVVCAFVVGFGTEAGEVQVPAKAKKFVCAPKRLHPGDSLVITISVPHAIELGVSTPQNDFIFLYACEGNRSQDDCAAFTKVSSVKIGTGLVPLPVFGNADWRNAQIFKAKGWYTFLMAKNLETENTEMSISRCAVYYTGDK